MTGTPSDAPRDPGHYRLSRHAGQRRTNRGIRYEDITRTIEKGIVQPDRGGWPNVRFIHVPMGTPEAVGVAANAESGVISTVFWAYECTHPSIVALRKDRGIAEGSP